MEGATKGDEIKLELHMFSRFNTMTGNSIKSHRLISQSDSTEHHCQYAKMQQCYDNALNKVSQNFLMLISES